MSREKSILIVSLAALLLIGASVAAVACTSSNDDSVSGNGYHNSITGDSGKTYHTQPITTSMSFGDSVGTKDTKVVADEVSDTEGQAPEIIEGPQEETVSEHETDTETEEEQAPETEEPVQEIIEEPQEETVSEHETDTEAEEGPEQSEEAVEEDAGPAEDPDSKSRTIELNVNIDKSYDVEYDLFEDLF